jgi:hypothetical protein
MTTMNAAVVEKGEDVGAVGYDGGMLSLEQEGAEVAKVGEGGINRR